MTSKPNAFTLIELLVVVSIIALLISILLPSLSAARDQGKAVVCLANVRRIGMAGIVYVDENAGVYPPFRLKMDASGAEFVNRYGRRKPRWQWFFDQGVGPPIDPSPYGGEPFGDAETTTMTNDYFICPSLRGEFGFDIRNGAYGYNYQYLGNSRTDTNPPNYDNFPVIESALRSPGATVMVGGSQGGDRPHGKHSYTLDPPRLAREVNAQRFGPKQGKDGSTGHSPAEPRHRARASVAFCDGHADRFTLDDLGYRMEAGGANPNDPSANNRLWNGRGQDTLWQP